MRDTVDVFTAQSELMKTGIALIVSRAEAIEQKLSAHSDGPDKIREMAIYLFTAKSLRLYAATLVYLSGEILSHDEQKYVFLLPNVRTLLEIHARFLDLNVNCHDDEQRALRCIHYHLFKVASLRLPEPTRTETYTTILEGYRPFLQKVGIMFPDKPEELTYKKWLEDRGHSFTRMNEVLIPDNIKKFCVLTQNVFGGASIYDMYSYFSELVHGNPYLSLGSPYNERFWVTSVSITTTAFLIELIDRCVIGTPNKSDFRLWLKELEMSKEEFLNTWKGRQPGRPV